jgi:hypothetical protein
VYGHVKISLNQFYDFVIVFWFSALCGRALAYFLFCTYSISKSWSFKIMTESLTVLIDVNGLCQFRLRCD